MADPSPEVAIPTIPTYKDKYTTQILYDLDPVAEADKIILTNGEYANVEMFSKVCERIDNIAFRVGRMK